MFRHTTPLVLIALAWFPTLFSSMQPADVYEELIFPFDVHITERTREDIDAWNAIKEQGLLFEKPDRSFLEMLSDFVKQEDPYEAERVRVDTHLRTNYGAEQRIIKTSDGVNLSTLIRTVKNPRATLVYVTGYFMNQTPTSQWVAPFYNIFPDCNLISFDWRSKGNSDGTFSIQAINDVRAALELAHSDPSLNNAPTVLVAFCLGGTMVLESLVDIQQTKPEIMPKALVLSCTQSETRVERAIALSPNKVMTAIGRIGLLTNWTKNIMVRKLLDPSFERISPVERIKNITIPVCFEYCTKKDLFAPIEDCYELHDAAYNAPLRFIIASDLAGHVRLHKETPLQYRDAYLTFFEKAGITGQDALRL